MLEFVEEIFLQKLNKKSHDFVAKIKGFYGEILQKFKGNEDLRVKNDLEVK